MAPVIPLLFLLAASGASDTPPRTYKNAVLVSVDGLRSDALLAVPPAELPGFARLRRGASTLNARTDPDSTVTLPNHTAMITGRFLSGESGHGWTGNQDPPPGATIHGNRGAYVAGIFDVAHDRGWRTALLAGKTKFSLYDVSWNAEHGAPDVEGTDEGRDKIDEFLVPGRSSEIADGVLRELRAGRAGALVLAHFAVTDLTAHASGWDVTPGSKYMQAVGAVDAEIARMLDGIEADEALRGKTAVVLTTDHGGGAPFKSHDQPTMWVDYIIPFLVWTGDAGPSSDLYELNADVRRDPGLGQPAAASKAVPPIRNGDAGNLVLSLLGLPPVPGSTINAAQELKVFSAR